MFKKLFIICICLAAFCSCASTGYSKFYDEWNKVEELTNYIPLKQNEKPIIRQSKNVDIEYYDILAENYYCLGCSSFEGLYAGTGDIEEQAIKIGATLVLYGISYSKTVNLSSTTTFAPDGRTATTTSSNIDRYDHTAYYFVKCTTQYLVGLSYGDLDNSERKKVKRNTGAIVSIVYKDTPAFFGNIMRGDVIIQINKIDIKNSEDAERELNKLKKGDIVNIIVWRDNKEIPLVLKL